MARRRGRYKPKTVERQLQIELFRLTRKRSGQYPLKNRSTETVRRTLGYSSLAALRRAVRKLRR